MLPARAPVVIARLPALDAPSGTADGLRELLLVEPQADPSISYPVGIERWLLPI